MTFKMQSLLSQSERIVCESGNGTMCMMHAATIQRSRKSRFLRSLAMIVSTVTSDDRAAFCLRDAGLVLGVSERTVRRLIADKQLLAKKIGTRTVVTRDALDEFLQNAPAAVLTAK